MPQPAGRLAKGELDSLVRAARNNDRTATARLLAVLRPVVTRYCRARLHGRDLRYLSADDVAQEVSVAVLRALPGYEDRGGSFLNLVFAIAANKVADAYRLAARDRLRPVAELPDLPEPGNEPESQALRLDLGSTLRELLVRLAPIQKEILALRIVVGRSVNETAQTLGISPVNVRVTQHRALARLRGMLKDQDC
ncbi:sigma-70 family RNA polymerase sigma factor [Amycolatopsis nivea]